MGSSGLDILPPAVPKRPRALAVDDDEAVGKVHRRLLEWCGFDADLVMSGQQAIAAVLSAEWHGEPFDLVLMDIDMPMVNGWVASAAIRHNGYTGSLVLLSEGVEFDTPSRCANCGVDHFVLKPTTADVLITLIKACLPDGARTTASAPPGLAAG